MLSYNLLYSLKHPMETFGYSFIFSLTGYAGINIVLHLVKHFGALIAVTGKLIYLKLQLFINKQEEKKKKKYESIFDMFKFINFNFKSLIFF